MKTTLTVLGALLVLFVVIIAMNWPSDAENAAYGHQHAVEEECDKMMYDSALGSERRMTREMCDGLKARARERIEQARRDSKR